MNWLLLRVRTVLGHSYVPCHRGQLNDMEHGFDYCMVVAASDDKEAIAAAYRLLKEG